MDNIISKIKQKKELSDIPDSDTLNIKVVAYDTVKNKTTIEKTLTRIPTPE